MKDQITYNGKKYQRVNEASMELKKLEDAIKMFQKKIKKYEEDSTKPKYRLRLGRYPL